MQNGNFNISVNGKFEYSLHSDDLKELDLVKKDGSAFHLVKDQKSVVVEVLGVDLVKKEVALKVGDGHFAVAIADKYDLLVERLGLNINVIHKINEIKAPMPGLVLDIEVSPGDEVVQGDALLVMEAMKMENVIKSSGEGKVKAVFVEKGKAVDKGEVLIEME